MSTQLESSRRAFTTSQAIEMKSKGEKIAMLTGYDFTTARLLDLAGVDIVLVGDSASNVFAGNETTLPMTLEEMIYHVRAVVKGVQAATGRAMIVADMPFMTYQLSPEDALKNAGRLMKETGCHAVKLEGGEVVANAVKRISDVGIPVMAHLGLTPQSIYKFGSYKVRAKDEREADALLRDAKQLEESGAFAIVLEKIPRALAEKVTRSVGVPTIGIGAGDVCDGQVLVVNDLLGLNNAFKPRFVRRYANLEQIISDAVKTYVADVKRHNFPNESESY